VTSSENNAGAIDPIPRVDEAPRFPLVLRGFVALLSLIVAGSAVAGVVIAWRQGPPILIGFEAVIVMASVFSFLIGLGYFRQAPAMGVFITGGAVLVGACLGEPRLVLRFLGNAGSGVPAGGVDLLPYAYARLAVAIGFFALGALLVLIQRPATSFRRLAVGVALAVPLALMGVAFANQGIRSSILSLNGIALAGVIVVLMIIVLGLVAASGHAIIRAFEAGLPEHAEEPTG
jgi:hypothetical protein